MTTKVSSEESSQLALRQVALLHTLSSIQKRISSLLHDCPSPQRPKATAKKPSKSQSKPKSKNRVIVAPRFARWVARERRSHRESVPVGSLSQHVQDLLGRDDELMERLRAECAHVGVSPKFRRTPDDYYEWTLEHRRDYLGLYSILQLCKTVIMQNTKCKSEDWRDPLTSKYFAVVTQYVDRLHNDKLCKLVRNASNGTISRSKVNFRLADEKRSLELSGFAHNAVTIVGMRCPIPVIMSDGLFALLSDMLRDHKVNTRTTVDAQRSVPDSNDPLDTYLWLGGGEVDVKWRVSVRDLLEVFHPLVGDITYAQRNIDLSDA